MNYLTQAKQIELEARFNTKLKYFNIKISLYFEFQPQKDELSLICKAEINNVDKAFICSVEININLIYDTDKQRIYELEEKWLDELVDLYKERLNELRKELN